MSADAAGIFGVESSRADSKVVLIPVPFDATTSYGTGTREGPRAILEASVQVDLFDLDYGSPHESGIYLLPENPQVHAWNMAASAAAQTARAASAQAPHCVTANEYGAKLNSWLHEQASSLLNEGRIVGVVGGDHATPFGSIVAHLEKYPEAGILHIDAHADLREAYEGFTWSHASIMHNVLQHTDAKSLVQVGIRDFCVEEYEVIQQSSGRVRTFFDNDLRAAQFAGRPWNDLVSDIVTALPNQVYISFDIDGLDPTLCPSTGTPVPGGLSFAEVVGLLRRLKDAGKQVVGFDLNEVAPGPDGSQWDGNVGARILYKLCGLALTTQPSARR